MLKPLQFFLIAAILGLAPSAGAITVVECVDADGNSSFRDKCPPGMSKKGEKRLTGLGGPDPDSLDAIAAASPVTVYTASACDACDLVINALDKRSIPYNRKAVEGNPELQQELQGIAGSLTVPTLTVGERILTGYSRDAIHAALDEAGYPAAGSPAAARAGNTPPGAPADAATIAAGIGEEADADGDAAADIDVDDTVEDDSFVDDDSFADTDVDDADDAFSDEP